MTLPEGVERSVVRKKSGKVYTYYYWNPGRGTAREGGRIQLPSADSAPDRFWAEVSSAVRPARRPSTRPDRSVI